MIIKKLDKQVKAKLEKEVPELYALLVEAEKVVTTIEGNEWQTLHQKGRLLAGAYNDAITKLNNKA